MNNIKILFTNGDITETRINGTDKEVITFYNENNFLRGKEEKQIESIRFTKRGQETGFQGCKESNIIYNFEYNKQAECYLCNYFM